ncbi:MAG TPA: hypothetical protein VGJ34_03695 [Gaiellaceae bacterium]|jgi:hypothetical protein
MDGDLAERVTAAVGVETVEFRSPKGEGYTNNERRLVRLADGGTAFVKAAVDDLTAEWLRDEWRVYAVVRAPFLPALLGWHDDGERPVLVLEDLSAAYWPPPWSSEHVASLLAALEMVAKSSPPAGLPSLESMRTELAGWELVADDREPFLSLGLATASWLDAALPTLLAASQACVLAGEDFLHFDVRSDNVCFLGERTVLVDWNWAVIGNPKVDVAAWLPSLHAERRTCTRGDPPGRTRGRLADRRILRCSRRVAPAADRTSPGRSAAQAAPRSSALGRARTRAEVARLAGEAPADRRRPLHAERVRERLCEVENTPRSDRSSLDNLRANLLAADGDDQVDAAGE